MGLANRLKAALEAFRCDGPEPDRTGGATSTDSSAATSPQPAYVGELQQSADRVREAAKWLIAVFGAIAAILIAGTQFSNIGSLPFSWRLATAIAGAVIALASIAFLIWVLLGVLMPSQVSLGDLARQARSEKGSPLVRYVEKNPEVLMGFGSIRRLQRAYARALSRRHREVTRYYAVLTRSASEEDPATRQAEARARIADGTLTYIDGAVSYLAKLLSVEQLRSTFGLRRQLLAFTAAAAAAVGIGLFAWAANPETGEQASDQAVLAGAVLSGSSLNGVNLTGANLRGALLDGASLVGANLKDADLSDADLTDADLRGAVLTDVTWSNTTCPDGTNSDTHQNKCEGHAVPR